MHKMVPNGTQAHRPQILFLPLFAAVSERLTFPHTSPLKVSHPVSPLPSPSGAVRAAGPVSGHHKAWDNTKIRAFAKTSFSDLMELSPQGTADSL